MLYSFYEDFQDRVRDRLGIQKFVVEPEVHIDAGGSYSSTSDYTTTDLSPAACSPLSANHPPQRHTKPRFSVTQNQPFLKQTRKFNFFYADVF